MFDIISKNEIKLLKTILRLSKKYNNNTIPLSDISLNQNYFYLSRLILRKLVCFTDTDNWGANPKKLVLTEEGQKFFEYRREATKQFLYRSIFTPIIVSSLTTLVTLFLTWLIRLVITK